MTKILIQDETYYNLITLLKEIKLTQGNLALNGTLTKHPKIKKYLIQKQIDSLTELENDVTL